MHVASIFRGITEIALSLAIVATVFLPLGLLTGLLGINVGGIPGSDYHWAFLIVCIILIVIAVFEYMAFRRKGFF